MPDLSSLQNALSTVSPAQINLAIGALIVPLLLQLLKREGWKASTCRFVAYGFAVAVAAAETFLLGYHGAASMAANSVAIFAAATGVYHLFFQGSFGDATQLDLIGRLLGKTIGDVASKNEAAVIADLSEIVSGIEQPK